MGSKAAGGAGKGQLSPSTRAADSIARPSSLLLRVVLAMRAAAVTRWWRACGREGRDCGLTAATSARPGCAVRCGRELKSESLQYAHSRLWGLAAACRHLCLDPRYSASVCER